jgi:hypothetical protein
MRKLLIVNLVFAGLLLTCYWTFAFFTHGAFVNPVGLIIGVICGWCALMPLLLAIPVLFVANIYGVFKFWSEHKWRTLLPFLILGVALFGLRIWDVSAMSIRRFEKYLPDYEAFVAKVEKEYKPGDRHSMGMPKEYRHLGYLAIIYDDEPNNLYELVEVGHFGVFGHTYFLHSSNGDIARGSKGYRKWPDKERVNEHWFRVSD